MFKKGSVVLIPFPFTDLSSAKVRPAVIVSRDTLKGEDFTVAFLSSVMKNSSSSAHVFLRQNCDDFVQTGLKTDSVIVANKLATLSKKTCLGEIGRLSKDMEEHLNDALRYVFCLE
jgi:mRNA interferase MazF